ncbi:MAG: alpha/beta hydrolase [Desulfovibrio sp.]|nr:alpha/beta hydrolase [Desulfovibrio sp.]
MPKPAKRLWERVVEWDNLLLAAKEAARNKRFRREVLAFSMDLECNLVRLRRRLESGLWRPGPYRTLEVYEPKRRLVHAPCFADRVVHHALMQVIGPCFERRFLDCSFACRQGKGTHAASMAATRMLRSASTLWGRAYVLKADISQYFASIDREILLGIVRRTIGDRKVLAVIQNLVMECGCIPGVRGLPLGALTSQLFANAYLDVLDHHVKDKLGVKHYVRYMDDFVILSHGKAELWELLAEIRDFLAVRLRLSLNPKTGVYPASHGVDFAGYRHWPNHCLPRKRNIRKAAKRFQGLSRVYAQGRVDLDTVRSVVASFVGYMAHCKGWRSAESALRRLVLVRPSEPEEED